MGDAGSLLRTGGWRKAAGFPRQALSDAKLEPVLITALYLASFFLLNWLSQSLRSSSGVSLKYLPEGLSVAMLIRFGLRYSPLLFIGPFFKGLAIYPVPQNLLVLFGQGAISVGVFTITALVLRRNWDIHRRPWGLKEVLVFITAAFIGTLLVSLGSVGLLRGAGLLAKDSLVLKITRLWIGDLLGIITLTPFLIINLGSQPTDWKPVGIEINVPLRDGLKRYFSGGIRPFEVVLQAGAIVLALTFALSPDVNGRLKHYYFCFIPIIWIALRYGLRGATLGILAVNLGILMAVSEWQAPLKEIADAQLFVLVITLTSLLLGAAISDRRKAMASLFQNEERLRRMEKMDTVDRLVGGVAHEFNNLLTAINGYSDMVLGQLERGHPLRSSLEEIRRAGEKAAGLTEKLLNLSRKRVVATKTVDLNRVVAVMEGVLRGLVGDNIEIELHTDANPAFIKANPGQLEQVLLNLVLNAREAMPAGGKLGVRVEHLELKDGIHCFNGFASPGGYVVLSVSDSGRGMNPEVRAHLFEPFFTTKGVASGAGLGLSTVYGVVEQAGAKIKVESIVGSGTIVMIFFRGLVPMSDVGGRKISKPETQSRRFK